MGKGKYNAQMCEEKYSILCNCLVKMALAKLDTKGKIKRSSVQPPKGEVETD